MIVRGEAGTRYPYEPTTLHALLEKTARMNGDREALIADELRLSWTDLHTLSRTVAKGLIGLGVQPGDRVAAWLPNRPEWVALWFGCSHVGAVLVPINTRLKARDAGYILKQTDCRVLFMLAAFLGIDYRAQLASMPAVPTTVIIEDDWDVFFAAAEQITDAALDAIAGEREESDPTIIVYTSGTTGNPKGAVHTHRILRNEHSIAEALGHDARSRVANHMPFFHVAGGFTGVLPPLICGGAMILMDHWDPAEALRLIEAEKITVFSGIPTHFIDLIGHPERSNYDISSLRTGWIGGANNPPEVIRAVIERLGMDGVLPVYGMTETTSITCIPRLDDPLELICSGKGFPVSDIEICVMSLVDRTILGPGVEGEVCQRGHLLMQGYYKNVEATAAAIDADGWFHTGDLGVLDADGYLSITGRTSDMFIVGGSNAYPAEIESVLAEHPAIQQAYVVGAPDARLGEIGYAFIELRAGESATPDELVAFCKAQLPGYKVPRRVEFVTDWPLTATGKIQRFRLRELADARVSA